MLVFIKSERRQNYTFDDVDLGRLTWRFLLLLVLGGEHLTHVAMRAATFVAGVGGDEEEGNCEKDELGHGRCGRRVDAV